MTRFLLFLLPFVIVLPQDVKAWSEAKDNKSVAELELMNEHELASEAEFVCNALTVITKMQKERSDPDFYIDKVAAGHSYLTIIYRIARKKHGGDTPKWTYDMLKASNGENSESCSEVSFSVLREELKGKSAPSKRVKKKQ